jgi:hypothetical protein
LRQEKQWARRACHRARIRATQWPCPLDFPVIARSEATKQSILSLRWQMDASPLAMTRQCFTSGSRSFAAVSDFMFFSARLLLESFV